jgi:Fe-S oxidoreductase
MSDGGVGLMLGCCCAPAHWAGQEEQFRTEVKNIEQQWDELGRPEFITACSTCYRTFRDHLSDIPVVSLWEVLSGGELPETASGSPETVFAVHDPCTTRSEPDIYNGVRSILDRLGTKTEELKLSREKTECCGFGGLMMNANPDLAKEVVARRAGESKLDYLAYCAMCRDNLAKAGKRTVHVLDLLFPDSGEPDPASSKRPWWSERQESR